MPIEDLPLNTAYNNCTGAAVETLNRDSRIPGIALAKPPTWWINVCALYAAGRLIVDNSHLHPRRYSADPLTRGVGTLGA